MTYRDPRPPDEDLPDLVGGSAKRAGRNLALVGTGSLLSGVVLYATTVLALAQVTAVLAGALGIFLIVVGAVIALRRR